MSRSMPWASEDQRWNRMSDQMNNFHAWFKQEFNEVYELADGSFNKRHMSLPMYLNTARGLIKHLNLHHSIEEEHIFPILGKRMPEFADHAKHIESHQGIHKGLDELSVLVDKYAREPSTYAPTEMRACLDGFRDVLFRHLDEEVQDLKADNMKKYWSLDELDRLPM